MFILISLSLLLTQSLKFFLNLYLFKFKNKVYRIKTSTYMRLTRFMKLTLIHELTIRTWTLRK